MEGTRIRIITAGMLAASLAGGGAAAFAAQQDTPQPVTQTPPMPATQTPPVPATMTQPATQTPPTPTSMAPPTTHNQPMSMGLPSSATQAPPPTTMSPQEEQNSDVPTVNETTIHQVRVPGNITFQGWKLALNGAGVHTKWFFFDKYVGALYLSDQTNLAAAAISGAGAKVIRLTMLTDISKDDFTSNLHSAYQSAVPEDKTQAVQSKWQQFASFFTDLKTGDTVVIAYVPDEGTSVSINGKPRGTVPGHVFGRAILGMWLGDDPIDSGLKKNMLGLTT
ncbi:MAG TPA: chalcone isomerase family protein [Gammaproteobacteria bacterium]|nr:chalcone isomerase family protein [Gammaproteobacteria bacterium]